MMKMVSIFSFFLLFSSCKKTKLEGNMSVLVGKWKWTHTLTVSYHCNYYHFTGPFIKYTPSTVGYDCELTFEEKGKIKLKKGSKEKKYRLIYEPDVHFAATDTAFAFHFNGKNKGGISVYYHIYNGIEYLETPDFPSELTEDDCEGRISIFQRAK